MKKMLKLAVLCFAAAFQWSAVAAPIVDQDNPTREGGFCYLDQGQSCGQSFQQQHSNISGAGIFIAPDYIENEAGAVTLSIFSAYNDGAPSGLIASGTSAANVNSRSGWVDVFFTPAAVSAGLQYYLIAESTNRLVASFSGRSNDYANGNAVLFGADQPSFDLTFRTYFDNNVQQVPEPGSFALLAIGIAGFGVARRKKHGQ
jgi:hypothetical protein